MVEGLCRTRFGRGLEFDGGTNGAADYRAEHGRQKYLSAAGGSAGHHGAVRLFRARGADAAGVGRPRLYPDRR